MGLSSRRTNIHVYEPRGEIFTSKYNRETNFSFSFFFAFLFIFYIYKCAYTYMCIGMCIFHVWKGCGKIKLHNSLSWSFETRSVFELESDGQK